MADDKKSYRITTRRPIAGRMRAVGEIVALTDLEHRNEVGWGGLEPVQPETATEQVAAGEPDAASRGKRK